MQSNTERHTTPEVVIVTHVIKQGDRYLLSVPKKDHANFSPIAGKPVRARIEVLV